MPAAAPARAASIEELAISSGVTGTAGFLLGAVVGAGHGAGDDDLSGHAAILRHFGAAWAQ
jgi:hypothetical protein